MINGNFDLPPASVQAMNQVRAILGEAAEKLYALKTRTDIPIDQASITRALQKLQSAKDVACQAFLLPHAPVVKKVV